MSSILVQNWSLHNRHTDLTYVLYTAAFPGANTIVQKHSQTCVYKQCTHRYLHEHVKNTVVNNTFHCQLSLTGQAGNMLG